MIEVEINADIFNACYLPVLDNRDRYLHLYGGAGSGKSVFAVQKVILRCLEEPGHRFLFIRKVARTIRKSLFQLTKEILADWGLLGLVRVRESDLEIHFPNGSTIVSVGVDDPEKLKSIAGISGILIEEATELSERDFNQIDLRLRGATVSYKQIILCYNPIDALHWLKERFHDKSTLDTRTRMRARFADRPPVMRRSDNTAILKTTYRDNAWIDAEYEEQLQKLEEVDPTFAQIYKDGEWATPENIIFTRWTLVDSVPENYDERIYGLDFGFNNPSALTEISLADSLLYARELLYQTKLTNDQLIEHLKELVPKRSAYIYADAAEPQRIQEIYDAGFNIHPADKKVAPGLDFVKRFVLHIESGSANLLKEIKTYKYKQDKNGNVFDEPVKFSDHAMDSLRYGVFTHGQQHWTQIASPIIKQTARKRRKKSNILEGYH